MSVQVEKLEKNMAKLTIEVSAAEFEKALEDAFLKNKNKISVPGFRKGKVPRQMVEKMYGPEIFYEDAANALIPDAYSKALDECEEDIVSSPDIDVTQIEKGKSFIFTATVALKPEVKLGKYKGVKVEAIEVTVQTHQFEQNLEQGRGNNSNTANETGAGRKRTRRINLNAAFAEEEPQTEEDRIAADMMSANGNTVDFTA